MRPFNEALRSPDYNGWDVKTAHQLDREEHGDPVVERPVDGVGRREEGDDRDGAGSSRGWTTMDVVATMRYLPRLGATGEPWRPRPEEKPMAAALAAEDVARVLAIAAPSGDIASWEVTPDAYPVLTPSTEALDRVVARSMATSFASSSRRSGRCATGR
jgi:hypothetical protein